MKNIFEYYLMAFTNCFNYRDASRRSELNYFILIFSVIYFVLFFIGFLGVIMTVILNQNAIPIAFGILMGVILIYSLMHILPFVALIYRRIKDIFVQKAKLAFGIYITVWALQVAACIVNFAIVSSISPSNQPAPETFAVMFIIGILAQLCGLAMFGFLIFLMCKKGNL